MCIVVPLLASLSALGMSGLAGCASFQNDDIPAGSLQFENQDNLPTSLEFRS